MKALRTLSRLNALAIAVALNLLLASAGFCLQPTVCPPGETTSVSGTVHAPNGTSPIYNALIYVPNGAAGATTYGVQAMTPGVNCGQFGSDITGSPLISTFSAVDGTFKLTNMPSGTNIPLVIQIGRWRRKITITNLPSCVNTPLTNTLTRLPTKQAEFDPADNVPLIAIATGSVDAIECLLRKIGIADAAFSDPPSQGGSGRVQFYKGATVAGSAYTPNTPSETQLWGTQASINQYDMVLFACQGSQATKTAPQQQIIINYANAGGRIFATHYEYVWLFNDAPFNGTATWNVANDGSAFGNDPGTGLVQTNFPGGLVLAQWLTNTGASLTYGQVPINTLRDDFTGVVAPSQLWLKVNDPNLGSVPMLYSFDTPVGSPAANQCGRVMFCDFHPENASTGNTFFPSECTTSILTPQELFLEYMIFQLGSSLNQNTPLATTQPATGVSATTSVLNGSVNPSSSGATAYFEYGLDTGYGSVTSNDILPGSINSSFVSNTITGLTPNTTYHYQVVAGTTLGGDMTFTTAAAPQPVAFSLTSAGLNSGGAFQFSFTNVSGVGFNVLDTTNVSLPLSNWAILGTAVETPPGSGNYQFTDTNNSNQAKYYRAVSH